jgi:Plasma-membrane choline transporter
MNDNGTHSHSQKFDESAQPREIKRSKGNQVPNRISITPTSLPPSRSSRHRRTHSSDERILPPGEFLPPSYGVYQNPPPLYNVPQAMQYSPRIPQGAPRPRRTPPTNNFSATDRSRERPSHVRSRSWNEEKLQMQGLSTSGNPLIPVLHDMGQNSFTMGIPSPRQQGRQHRFYQEATGRPRENKNLREMMPYEIAQQDAPPPSTHMSSPRPRPEHWSPRTEIMTIAKGFHSKNYSPPISPNANATNTGFRTVSPRISPNNPSFSSAHISPSIGSIHAQYGSHDLMDRPLTSSGSYRSLHAWPPNLDHCYTRESDVLLPNVGNPTGGTADEPLGESSRSRSKRFSRKMQHMRQKSAQLFMENYRGTPQPTSCRDVLFVLLFLFHLAGMTLLGKLYGSEATQGDQAVTLSYRNVVYMSCICGAFAVVVSTITLIIMMSITKKIIQFSLFLSITLSFAWGTIGIGLSPKNFVPITGIIALALSVGYAFVVWDRIPFASSNLHAGLSAIRANMGTVLVAFLCQGIALGWTVYYTFVVVGVYDALKVGDLVLTKNMRIFVFTMLGISFYWTFHVLMVSYLSLFKIH